MDGRIMGMRFSERGIILSFIILSFFPAFKKLGSMSVEPESHLLLIGDNLIA